MISSIRDRPYAVKTALSWVVNGLIRGEDGIKAVDGVESSFSTNRISIAKIEELLIQQYNTDFSELSSEDKAKMSQKDHQFMQSVAKSIELSDGHYCIGLPLRNETAKMPNNCCIAEQRAMSLKIKLNKNPDLHKDYKGYAVKIPKEQLSREDGQVWYIPTMRSYHPKKKKICVVFNCTPAFQGTSLNVQLLQGSDLTNSLIGVHIRFREEPTALIADTESMFYQVKVPDRDADLVHFLWWPDGDLSQPMVF